jgi:hypothetical protein
MVLCYFLSQCIAPLQHCARAAWLYTEENDATRLEHSRGTDLGMRVMDKMLSKLSSNLISDDLLNPLGTLLDNLHGSGGEVDAAKGDAHAG